MRKLATRTAPAALIAGLALTTHVMAAEIIVNDDMSGPAPCDAPDQSSIQAAIDSAAAGDDILVCPGTYTEDLEIITKDDLTIIAIDRIDKSNTTIQGMATSELLVASPGFPDCGSPSDSIANIDIQANGTTISGFTIQGPATPEDDEYSCGIIIDGEDNKIYQNRFLTPNGAPGSVAIQTWFGGNNPAIKNISGLVIASNTFDSSSDDGTGLGYEAIFINDSTDVGADPVSIVSNWFGGNLYRGVGIARDRTDVKANEMRTNLPVQDTDDFGTVPLGIKVFASEDSNVAHNHILGTSKGNRFAYGIWAQGPTSGNLFDANVVQHSDILDCLDDSTDSGTLGTANIWMNNDGIMDEPKGICRPFANPDKKQTKKKKPL